MPRVLFLIKKHPIAHVPPPDPEGDSLVQICHPSTSTELSHKPLATSQIAVVTSSTPFPASPFLPRYVLRTARHRGHHKGNSLSSSHVKSSKARLFRHGDPRIPPPANLTRRTSQIAHPLDKYHRPGARLHAILTFAHLLTRCGWANKPGTPNRHLRGETRAG